MLELDPTSAKAYENLGVDELNAGDLAAAATDLSRAISLDPRLAGARNAMAAVHMRQGRTVEAIAEWKAAVQLDPRLFDALYNLGTVLYRAGRRDEAQPYLERFVREAPRGRYAADIAEAHAAADPLNHRPEYRRSRDQSIKGVVYSKGELPGLLTSSNSVDERKNAGRRRPSGVELCVSRP